MARRWTATGTHRVVRAAVMATVGLLSLGRPAAAQSLHEVVCYSGKGHASYEEALADPAVQFCIKELKCGDLPSAERNPCLCALGSSQCIRDAGTPALPPDAGKATAAPVDAGVPDAGGKCNVSGISAPGGLKPGSHLYVTVANSGCTTQTVVFYNGVDRQPTSWDGKAVAIEAQVSCCDGSAVVARATVPAYSAGTAAPVTTSTVTRTPATSGGGIPRSAATGMSKPGEPATDEPDEPAAGAVAHDPGPDADEPPAGRGSEETNSGRTAGPRWTRSPLVPAAVLVGLGLGLGGLTAAAVGVLLVKLLLGALAAKGAGAAASAGAAGAAAASAAATASAGTAASATAAGSAAAVPPPAAPGAAPAAPAAQTTPVHPEAPARPTVDPAAREAAHLRQEAAVAAQARAQASASRWGWATSAVEWLGWGADRGVDALSKVTGPVGKQVSVAYKLAKGAGEGLGNAMAAGGDYAGHVAQGLGKGALDVVTDAVLDKAMVGLGERGIAVPGLKDYTPGVDWSQAKVSSVVKMVRGDGYHHTVTDMVRDRLTTSAKYSAQQGGQAKVLQAVGLKPS